MSENTYAGTQTEKNLQAAFAGESQARNKYTFFASVAKKEGMEQIASLFLKTADNEKEHAKMWFKELGGIGDTLKLQPTAKTSSGPICTKTSPRPPKQKASRLWLPSSAWLAKSRSIMKSAIVPC